MNHSSIIELNPKALRKNLRFIRKQLPDSTRLCSVVKGNAYGHGIEEFIPLCEDAGINYFAVYNSNEAYRVFLTAENDPDIMVMGYIDNADLDWAIEHGIEFFTFEPDRLKVAIEKAKRLKKKARIHLEIETGMNRTGFSLEQLSEVIPLISTHKDNIVLEGICTHFAGAESIGNYVRIQQQKAVFHNACDMLGKAGLVPRYRHVNCSAGMIRYPEMNLDLVRIGILQYGFWPSMETFIEYSQPLKNKDNPLKRILSWKTKVMSTKQVSKGSYIGYGTTYLAQRNMTIAIAPVGYAHGYSRILSNQGRVLVHGKRCPVVGIVNMNAIAIDISNCREVKKDDEVTLIGQQGNHTLSVASFGELSNQLNYELLTRLPMDIPRYIIN